MLIRTRYFFLVQWLLTFTLLTVRHIFLYELNIMYNSKQRLFTWVRNPITPCYLFSNLDTGISWNHFLKTVDTSDFQRHAMIWSTYVAAESRLESRTTYSGGCPHHIVCCVPSLGHHP